MSIVKEIHVKCPYEKQCTSVAGNCHRWKLEATAKTETECMLFGLSMITTDR